MYTMCSRSRKKITINSASSIRLSLLYAAACDRFLRLPIQSAVSTDHLHCAYGEHSYLTSCLTVKEYCEMRKLRA